MGIGAIELDVDQVRVAARLGELVDRRGRPVKRHRGIYLHGRPGRGKTMLMDRFFTSVTSNRKRRFHFHSFFAQLHTALAASGSIDRAIDALLGDAELVCFDEFHVHDIGDAMLIARTLDTLFARRIMLVATSNYPPQDLLPNPLFHDRFLPTIARIIANLDVLSVDGPLDYRTRTSHSGAPTGFVAGRYLLRPERSTRPQEPNLVPGLNSESDLDSDVESGLPYRAATSDESSVSSDSSGLAAAPAGGAELTVGTQHVHARAVDGVSIVIDFAALCGTPTSSADYVELAQHFSNWTLCNVPRLRDVPLDWAMRLVNLVDVLYDADLQLTISAQAPLADLVADVPLSDLSRTASRLTELAQPDPTPSPHDPPPARAQRPLSTAGAAAA
ncbi:cell division protein ZapE [Nocardia sp. GCM10030253]|uniref:cell division protein ZapE n=1 Tax=Nocardia sp. GCM10030253 TaxID=3273404 RepID=UPI00363B7FF3